MHSTPSAHVMWLSGALGSATLSCSLSPGAAAACRPRPTRLPFTKVPLVLRSLTRQAL